MSLTAGDIGFVLYNSDNPDAIGFVALVNIDAGVAINFTDRGWRSDNTFRIGEGVLTWTAPAGGVDAGTVITITGNGDSASVGAVVQSAGSYGLSTEGDQVLAYQGTVATPIFIAAINNQSSVWQSDAPDTNNSALPPGLTNGSTAIALNEGDNAVYQGPLTGNQATLQANLFNVLNWTTDDDSNQNFTGGSFTVTSSGGSGDLGNSGGSDGSGGSVGSGASGGSNTLTSDSLFLPLTLSTQIGFAGLGQPVQTFDYVVSGINIENIFDEGYYLATNPDVKAAVAAGALESGYAHFLAAGLAEGREPFQFYDEDFYLSKNADVAAAIESGALVSGLQHFLLSGHEEGRDPSAAFDSSDYLLNNPDVKAAVEGGAISSAFEHFANSGLAEGRLGGLLFDEGYYLANNTDIAIAVKDGLISSGWEHFLAFGQTENRDPSAGFDQDAYLAIHNDVAAAVAGGSLKSAFYHYATFGIAEGRAI